MGTDKERDLEKQVEEVKNNFRALGASLQGLTNESLVDLNEAAKGLFNDDWFKDLWNGNDDWRANLRDTWNNKWRDEFNENYRDDLKRKLQGLDRDKKWKFPSFYGSDKEKADSVDLDGSVGKGDGNWLGWTGPGSLFGDSFKYRLFSAFGLVSSGAPSVRKYNECLDKHGQQVYDINGYWRCLFPNSEISNKILNQKKQRYPDEILTKEDFLNEVRARNIDLSSSQYDLGDKGVFFKQFEDLMNWKSVMYKNIKNERRQLRDQKRRECKEKRRRRESEKDMLKAEDEKSGGFSGFITTTSTPVPVSDADSAASSNDKKVISTSLESTYSFDNGKLDYKEVRVEYYNDGTSSIITKKKPEETNSQPEDKKGWFWK